MKKMQLYTILAAGFCGGVCAAADYPSYVASPVGPGTVPPTTYESGLVPSINPIDSSGNLVVTGNIAGGGHFRGVVPYRGASDFVSPDSSLRSTSGAFDDFLRRSAGSQDFGRSYSGQTQSFYSPTQTVTRTVPGASGVITPGTIRPDATGLTPGQERYKSDLSGHDKFVSELDSRPISLTVRELEKIMANRPEKYPWEESKDNVQSVKLPRHLLKQSGGETTETAPGLPDNASASGRDLAKGGPFDWFTGKNQAQTDTTDKSTGEQSAESTTKRPAVAPKGILGMDIYDRMLQQLGRTPGATEEPTGTGGQATGVPDATGEIGQAAATPDAAADANGREAQSSKLSSAARAERIAKTDAPTKTQVRSFGRFDSFATISEDGFNEHIRAAEAFMKEGKYYRAADAYTLATIYKRSDPLGYAGKCHALFAAGEYMSSALYLARTLEIFPEYAKFKVDVVAMTGSKDTVETRVAEARASATDNNSAELEFLLSYVYYQLGRLEFARLSIEKAAKNMPDSPAVAAMQKAIDEEIAGQ